MKCSACGQPGHRRNNKKCRFYNQNNSSAANIKCSACGQPGHRRNSKDCPLYNQSQSNPNSRGRKKNPLWKDSDARRELKSIFLNDKDRKYLTMPAEKLRDLRETFTVFTNSKFKGYTMVLKSEVMKENKNWPEPWEDSTAKENAKSLLLQDFETYYNMDSDTFWKLELLFQQYPFEYFEVQLNKLKPVIKRDLDIVRTDEAALRHDRLIIPIKTTTEYGDPRWDRHPAKKLLKIDVDENKHKVMTPRELWKARKEYQDFTNGFKDTRKGKKVFRKHIYQEVYSRNQSAYWQYFKEQKKKKTQEIRKAIASS